MPSNPETLAVAAEILECFLATGAREVRANILQPADTLLDLYGEDIRARAFTTHDPLNGEMMLRPDFTVPVVQMHMTHGAEPARYAYCGKVFRRQEEETGRPSEYIQVGFELFDRTDPVAADAEVFALMQQVLAGLPVRAVTGDIGILTAAVAGLTTTDRRKAALMRHIWRPRRFRALLNRFGGRTPPPEARLALINHLDPMSEAEPLNGLRTADEIAERIEALRQDAGEPPILDAELTLLDDILSLRAPLPEAVERLRDMAVDMPHIEGAVDMLAERCTALAERDIDLDALEFEAAFGRGSMEYYDGFVFGFYATAFPDLPAIATGGRYDALTERLGQGKTIPAVGGVVRPQIVAELSRGAT